MTGDSGFWLDNKDCKKEMSPEHMAQTIYDKLKHKLDWAIGIAKSTVNT